MTVHPPNRLGDKALPFIACDDCGEQGRVFVIHGRTLCGDCSGKQSRLEP